MPSIATDPVTVRLPHEYLSHVQYVANQRGITRNALMVEIIGAFCAKDGLSGAEDTGLLDGAPTELYGVALSLIDDLIDEGYPESEIRGAFKNLRDEML